MQPPASDPDFRQEVLVDFQRSYGAGSVLPDCVCHALEFNKENCSPSILYKNKFKAKLLMRLHEDLAVAEAIEHLSFPKHCQEVYQSKNFLWLERLTKWAIEPCADIRHRKEDVLSFFNKVKKGLVTSGEIKPSGFWRLLPEADFLAKILVAEEEAAKKPSRRPEDHWASEDQIKEMNRQTEALLAKGLWEVVDISTAAKPIRASKCFPVEQGKTRLCVDYRRQSLLLYNSEKMRMLGTRASQEITGRLMSCYREQPALRQFKSDVKADVAAEKANRERTRAAAVEEVRERVRADLDFIKAMPNYRRDRRDHTLTGEEDYGFVPFSSTKDMSGYYYQYCVDNPGQNLLWMPMARPPGWGWDEAGPKRAMHELPLAPMLVQLGIAYELSMDAKCLSLSIDPSRITKLHEKGRDVILSLSPPRRVDREALDSFKGLLRHCTQLSPQFSHLVRPLDKWTDEQFFVNHIKDEKQRRGLKASISLLLTCVPFAQNMEMRAADYELPFLHVYTDASLENARGLNAVLARGQRRGLEEFKIFIGGMIVREDGSSEAFRTQLCRLPADIDSCHIGIIETLAVRAAALVFQKDLAKAYTIFHLNTKLEEAAINEIAELSIGEGAPPIYAKEVLKFFQDSTNEPKTDPEKKAADDIPEFKRLVETGVTAGPPPFSGPNICANMQDEKFQVFRRASKILEAQQVHNQMTPSLLLERMNLHSKSILAGETKASPAKVVGADKGHISDFHTATDGLKQYFSRCGEMSDIIKRDEAIMYMKTIRDFLVCAIDGINGSPSAWESRGTGEIRRFGEENMTIRVDEQGRLYLLNPRTKELQLVPSYVEAAAPPPAAKKQAVESASSKNWEKKLSWPENTRS
eukprot:g16762.t1